MIRRYPNGETRSRDHLIPKQISMKSVKERKIIADRGSVLPFLTCRWLKVNDVATDIETFEKTLPATEKPFEGLQLEGVSTDATKIMEAEIIHMIDNLDAEMMMMTSALALVGEGEMTNRIFALGLSIPAPLLNHGA